LIGKLAGMKGATGTAVKETDLKTAPVPERHIDVKAPNVAEAFLASAEKKSFPVPSPEPQTAGVDGKKESSSSPEKAALNSKKAVEVPAVAGAVNSLEGAMMWDGDSGKKKKGKIPSPASRGAASCSASGVCGSQSARRKRKRFRKDRCVGPWFQRRRFGKGPGRDGGSRGGKGFACFGDVSVTDGDPSGKRGGGVGIARTREAGRAGESQIGQNACVEILDRG
jgi:hypothetical protein